MVSTGPASLAQLKLSPSCAQFLHLLNPAQLKAVQHSPDVPLQILAGPGSGKTRVLTSRIAYLILNHSLPPSSICAVTFTNKAANEMRERLTKLIGKEKTNEVRMGTFHALCALFLRKYAHVIGLEGNFTVCDADESKKMVSVLLKRYKDDLTAKDITLKEGTVLSLISKAKAKGDTAADVVAQNRSKNSKDSGPGKAGGKTPPHDIEQIVAEIYTEYERLLRQSNCLDFDDLLLFGVKLFTQHYKAVNWCKHVLVDEFQDTNVMQYELMKTIAVAAHECVTVVGDPDQSIYGWRSAEVANLSKMQKDFPATERILLEENYRSTASILKASLAIVAQDKSRIAKSLHTSHPIGVTPVLVSFPSEQEEAVFIAVEIKRLVANMGGVLKWGDFVVLLRFNALSRAIENALQKEGIPSRILGGHKFFERLEVRDLLAYLQLVDNPHFVPAFTRAVNVPSRGIGEKTIGEITSRANKTKTSQLEVIEQIHDAKSPDIKPPVKRKLSPFINTVRVLRNLAAEGTSPADLIRRLLDLIDYENHLRKTQPDWESRWENVQELITFASEVEVDVNQHAPSSMVGEPEGGGIEESRDTPLRMFLQASMLSSAGDNQTEAESKEKVTISTCHAAKGLEWPVVMVPAVEQGTFPFYRTDDIEEERRLLYVACTRAQSLLYLSHSAKRKVAGETKTKEISEFVSTVAKNNQSLFTNRAPDFLPADRIVISRVLGRVEPQNSDVMRRIAEFNRTTRHHAPEYGVPETNAASHPCLSRSTPNTGAVFVASSNILNIPPGAPLHKAPAKQRPPPLPPASASAERPSTRMHPILSLQPQQSTGLRQNGAQDYPSPPSTKRPTLAVPTEATSSMAQRGTPLNLGGKRRLGMGRANIGYPNKKFKPPT